MPTKIIATPSGVNSELQQLSAPLQGLITEGDIKTITDDFANNCLISSSDPNRTFNKINSVSVPILAMDDLIVNGKNIFPHTDLTKIFVKIKFGITLPKQVDCKTGLLPEGNQLTVVVMIEDRSVDPIVELGTVATLGNNYILTTGFRASQPIVGLPANGDSCCPHEP